MQASQGAKLESLETLVTALGEMMDGLSGGAAEPTGNTDLQAAAAMGANAETEIDSRDPRLGDSTLGQQHPETTHGVTPLFSAVTRGSLPCLQVLIQAGASVNVSCIGGVTPLHLAAAREDAEILKCLFQAGADPNRCDDVGIMPIHVAVSCLPCLDILIQAGASINVGGAGGATPLHLAAANGNIETVKFLLEAGADPDKCDDNGQQPLLVAASMILDKPISIEKNRNTLQVVELLSPLTSSAPANFLDRIIIQATLSKAAKEKTRVEKAAFVQSSDLQQPHPIEPNHKAAQGVTLLFLSAISHGSLPLLELLIQTGASVNVGGIGGVTPLHAAAVNGNLEIVQFLLKAGANPNTCDDNGLQPIHQAALMILDKPISTEKDRNTLEIVELLLPLTSSTPAVSNMVDGIIQEALSKAATEKLQAQVEKAAFQKASDSRLPHPIEMTSETNERCAKAKKKGSEAFRRKDYLEAMYAYTQAIEFDPNDAVLLSNRSLCWLRAGQAERALEDAKTCRSLKPDWAKAYYRQGAALRMLKRFDEAADAFYEGMQLEPENEELENAFRETVQDRRKFQGNGKQNPAK